MVRESRQSRRVKQATRRFWIESLEDRQLLSNVFTVSNTLDDGSAGSLRWAITQVNGDTTDSTASPDQIQFDIPQSDAGFADGAWTIAPASALPAITNPVVIDGYTQPGSSPNTNGPGAGDNAVLTVVLNGANAHAGANGLTLSSTGITVRGLVVNGFIHQPSIGGDGITIDTAGGDVVEGNFIGTDAHGRTAVANSADGVNVVGTDGNTIGGLTPDARNVISGNSYIGINIFGGSGGGSDNLIAGNFVGTDASGTTSIANGINGIQIGAGGNTIGGATPSARNLISGNKQDGILVGNEPPAGNWIAGNYIGTDVTGSIALLDGASPQQLGIGLGYAGAVATTVGGTVAGAGNLISGNVTGLWVNGAFLIEGNLIGTDATGSQAVGNIFGLRIGGTAGGTVGGTTAAARNVIAGNTFDEIELTGRAGGDVIEGNYIGVDAAGSKALPGKLYGETSIGILDTSGATIGGTVAGAGNLICGNVLITEAVRGASTTDVWIAGNTMGLSASGAPLPAASDVDVSTFAGEGTVTGITIGGTVAGAGNVFAGDVDGGVLLSGPGTTGNLVAGNTIGNPTGPAVLAGPPYAGVAIEDGAAQNTIGGTTPGAGNVISGQLAIGIELADPGTSGNLVVGNDIQVSMPQENRPTLGVGVLLRNAASGNTIGGTSPTAANVIAGNAQDGVELKDTGTNDNLVAGNFIGITANGSALANVGDGVAIELGASDNTIGGTARGAGNTIAFNQGAGVLVVGTTTNDDAIEANSIFSNARLGIDLGGTGVPLVNSPGGPHAGPNQFQNDPVLMSVQVLAGATTITGTLNSTPGQYFRIEFFSSPTADPSGFGQGQTYLGDIYVKTGADGTTQPFRFTYSGDLTGQAIAATATDVQGNTSEFSRDVSLPAGTPQLDPASDTGVSHSDGITRNNGSASAPLVFDVTGVSPPDAFVQLYDATNPQAPVPLGNPVQATGTTAAITLSGVALPDGTYQFATTTSPTAGGTQSALSATSTVTIQTSLKVTQIAPSGNFYSSLPDNGAVTVTLNHWLAGITVGPDSGFASPPLSVMLIPSGPDGAATQQQTGSFWSSPSGVDSGDLPVPATLSYTANANGTSTLTLTPDQPLSTDVYLIVVSGLSDLAGNPVADASGQVGNVTSSFDYRPSPVSLTPPTVTRVTADNGAVVIGNNRIPQPDTIGIAFSKPMDTYTVNAATVRLFQQGVANPLPAAVAYSPTTQSAYLTPETTLAPGTVYYVSVSTAVTDDQGFPAPGVPLAQAFATSFTVDASLVDTSASSLTVLETNPANGTAWTAPLGYGAVTFSEPLNTDLSQSLLTRYSAMLVSRTGSAAGGTSGYADVPLNAKLAFNPNTNQLIIVPTGMLRNDTVYLFALSGIKAASGDRLADTAYSTFLLNSGAQAHASVLVRPAVATPAVPAGPLATVDAPGRAGQARVERAVAPRRARPAQAFVRHFHRGR